MVGVGEAAPWVGAAANPYAGDWRGGSASSGGQGSAVRGVLLPAGLCGGVALVAGAAAAEFNPRILSVVAFAVTALGLVAVPPLLIRAYRRTLSGGALTAILLVGIAAAIGTVVWRWPGGWYGRWHGVLPFSGLAFGGVLWSSITFAFAGTALAILCLAGDRDWPSALPGGTLGGLLGGVVVGLLGGLRLTSMTVLAAAVVSLLGYAIAVAAVMAGIRLFWSEAANERRLLPAGLPPASSWGSSTGAGWGQPTGAGWEQQPVAARWQGAPVPAYSPTPGAPGFEPASSSIVAGHGVAYPQPGVGIPYVGAPPLPPQTNGLAIAAFVTGLLGVGPIGLVLGIVALVQINGSQGRQKGGGFAIAGIVLNGLWIVVLIVLYIVLFAALSHQSS